MVDSQTPAKRNPSNKGLTCFSILSAARIEPSRFQMGKKTFQPKKENIKASNAVKKESKRHSAAGWWNNSFLVV
jgi:hypothetical protein